MKRTAVLWICLCAWTSVAAAQQSEPLKPSEYTFRLARLVLKDGTVKEGWFVGTVRDSVILQVGPRSLRFSRQDLIRVDVERKPEGGKTALAGMLVGMYAGTALLMNAEGQPTLFYSNERDEFFSLLLPEAAFALVGGGIGYVIGAARSNEDVYEFTGSEEENSARWEELSSGGPEVRRRSTVHLSIQGSWVSGPLPNPAENFADGNGYSNATRLNLIRRVQLTYSLSEFLDVGFAAMWLGQPSVQFYGYSPQFSSRSLQLTGHGYYAVGVIQPLWKLGWRDLQWDIGAAVGMASVDCRAISWGYDSYYQAVEFLVEKKKTTFSAAINTEFKVFIAEYLSLGVTADLVYIPEDVPDAGGFNFASTTLGSSSIGFVLGFHL